MAADKGILIVGVGGLGVPAALAIARRGVRCLGLIDPDPVEISNLHRQVIYTTRDVGESKVEAAARHLLEIERSLKIETFACALEPRNARETVARFDFVIDGTDTAAAKFLINDACTAAGRPFSYGGVLGLTGQLMTVIPGRSPCLRCLFETEPDAADVASCRDAGIIGPVAGAIGELQAREAIRYCAGLAPELTGAILTYDGAAGRVRVARVNARPGCVCGAYQPVAASAAPARN